jgi:predicted pyridoxine 5'-phosphate oxidase superfamily flavin-nucleotide-binding protein
MDYPHQARLKILGRARVIDADSEPGLLARLENPDYRARVERGIVIRIEGFDWNCSKHIIPRYTEEEIAQRTVLHGAAPR